MEQLDGLQDFMDDQSNELLNNTTPVPIRRLFQDQISTQPHLSKPDYMARAIRQMMQESPNVPTNELAIYLTEFEHLYEEYILNTPTAHVATSTEPNRIKTKLTPPQNNSLHTMSAIVPPSLQTNPIQVVISRDSYTDKEREVILLKPDATVQEFLIWQRGAKTTLALIDNYHDDILLRPRHHVTFNPMLTKEQIDKIYLNTWMKLHMATQKVCSQHSEIARIEPLQIHHLWKKLQTTYLPTTDSEIFKLEQAVYTLEQGNLSVKDFVLLLRDKTHELGPLGYPVQKTKILNILSDKLKNDTLKMFIFHLPGHLDLDECFQSILLFGKSLNNELPKILPALKLEQVLVVPKQSINSREYAIYVIILDIELTNVL